MSTSVPKNLESLSYDEIRRLEARLDAAKAKKYDEAVTALQKRDAVILQERKAMLLGAAAALGIKPQDAGINIETPPSNGKTHKVAKARRRPKKMTVVAKFRDPAHPELTWSGRGRMASWLAAKVKDGRKADEFRINA